MNEQIVNEESPMQEKKQKTGIATASLILGIISILTVLLFINYILGIAAIVLAVVFFVKKKEQKEGRLRAGIGLGLATLSIVISTVAWVSVYTYFMKTPVTQILEDVKTVTAGQIDPEKIINQAIDEALSEVLDSKTIEIVEGVLGKELSYQSLTEFVGGEVTVETIQKFVGDSIVEAERVQEIVDGIDKNVLKDDLGGEITYKALEDKIGKGFTYDELMQYLEGFTK